MTWLAAQRELSQGSSGLTQCLGADAIRTAIDGSPRSRRQGGTRSVEPGIVGASPRSFRSESPLHPTGPSPRSVSELSAGVSDRDSRRSGLVMLYRVVPGAMLRGRALRAVVALETSPFWARRLSDDSPLCGSSQRARALMEMS